MVKRFAYVLVAVALTCAGCGPSDRGEIQSMKAELAEARSELKALKEARQTTKDGPPPKAGQEGVLGELERLEALRAKGALTQQEFEAAKKKVLEAKERPAPTVRTMEELDKELRTLHGLWNNSTINQQDFQAKKQQLVKGPLRVTDLKADLERVQSLWNTSVITQEESSALKQRLLDIGPGKP
jgi:multidrug resistance efflux pump